ncbi:HNH endonuclease [Thalassobacillus hwangdonensis]|uniref:HNH endonuclease n=1 Tax=Thalassobacillus hwangdonensis TaxID=546108 RepID=A0ABW3KYE0_9BACI
MRAFHVAKARAKNCEVLDDLTMDELRVAYRFAQKRGCVYCGEKIGDDFSVDHVIPMSKGAHNSFWNIVVCHEKCNYRKHNKPASKFASKEKMDEIIFDMIIRSPYHEEAITNFLSTGEFISSEDGKALRDIEDRGKVTKDG